MHQMFHTFAQSELFSPSSRAFHALVSLMFEIVSEAFYANRKLKVLTTLRLTKQLHV